VTYEHARHCALVGGYTRRLWLDRPEPKHSKAFLAFWALAMAAGRETVELETGFFKLGN
jgi:hypothetical protein